ncbi:MGMT family protein [Aliiglaciecola sp. LCG003]|uniref:MGMT family protein n=1 Tax=Aliiglaciecola sp. LCG003 TaxID=3053655 RepID=UPI0025733423|nr:MGMT family protein [Aliiglaciecola sp. LCG003]WJG09416.1 MGMT family protein [Aliiglaciecola sp. LCG003]
MAASVSYYQKIWHTVQAIPAGKVASYGQVADLAGLPGRARLVGKALGYAPDDMQVPWYRVLRSTGQIAFPVGSEIGEQQKALLQQEEVAVLNHRVKLAIFQWRPELGDLLIKLKY